MAIPSQTEMFQFVLETMSDYPQFSGRQANNAVCEKLNLSIEEQNQKTSSGAAVYESRTGWTVTWLYAADCIERIKRGTYVITEKGKQIPEENLNCDEFSKRERVCKKLSAFRYCSH